MKTKLGDILKDLVGLLIFSPLIVVVLGAAVLRLVWHGLIYLFWGVVLLPMIIALLANVALGAAFSKKRYALLLVVLALSNCGMRAARIDRLNYEKWEQRFRESESQNDQAELRP